MSWIADRILMFQSIGLNAETAVKFALLELELADVEIEIPPYKHVKNDFDTMDSYSSLWGYLHYGNKNINVNQLATFLMKV